MEAMHGLLVSCILCFNGILNNAHMVSVAPPPHEQKAKTARYLLHNTDWAVIGTTSVIKKIAGRPFTNVISFCDGPVHNSTGTPYFYVINEDPSIRDVLQNPMISMTVSETESDYCKSKGFDPEDPRCSRLTLTGKMVNMTGSEKQFAMNSLFARHPEMKSWSALHAFYPTKMKIDMVWLLDFFGGASFIPVKDYYAVHL